MRVLLLAGTAEARALSHRLAAMEGIELVASLAGVTRAPAALGGTIRTGGFGGPEGLKRWLAAERIGAAIDATHPFAARMQANAAEACRAAGVPLLRLSRPEWRPLPGHPWHDVDTLSDAVAKLPPGAVAFVAAGRSAAEALLRDDVRFVLRALEPPAALRPNLKVLLAPPGRTAEAESALFRAEGVTHLISKNAGGAAGWPKLEAAAALDIDVLMIRRPAPPEGVPTVSDPEEAANWLATAAAKGATRA